MTKIHIVNTDGQKAFVEEALAHILNLLQKLDGPRLISLSGGNTPFPVYARLGQALSEAKIADHCYWIQTDERVVDRKSDRANQVKIRQSLLKGNFIAESSFFAAPLEHDHKTMPQQYHDSLLQLPGSLKPPHPIDLLILGMGTDGHVASLFPDTDWKTRQSSSGYAIFETASQPEKRLSLTLNRILEAKEIIFLVSGADKKEAFSQVASGSIDLPAAFVAANRPTTWICNFS